MVEPAALRWQWHSPLRLALTALSVGCLALAGLRLFDLGWLVVVRPTLAVSGGDTIPVPAQFLLPELTAALLVLGVAAALAAFKLAQWTGPTGRWWRLLVVLGAIPGAYLGVVLGLALLVVMGDGSFSLGR